MTVTDIARLISSRLYPGLTASVTYGGTVYLISGDVRLRQFADDEIKAIAPEIWPNLFELGRSTAREEMFRRGAMLPLQESAERQLLQAAG